MADIDTAVARLAAIKASIASTCAAVGRDPEGVTLIAVSKMFSAEDIRPLLQAGHRHFGENRVQEALSKWPALKADFSDIVLHLIGPLQSNKAADAVALFDVIHTLDRPKIAHAIADEMAKQGRALQLFAQVNTGAEPQKAGLAPEETPVTVQQWRTAGIPVTGLMCIPPIEEEPAVHFAFLAKLARDLELPHLSMGMSSDFATAIDFGATHVRVGSSIFGTRNPTI